MLDFNTFSKVIQAKAKAHQKTKNRFRLYDAVTINNDAVYRVVDVKDNRIKLAATTLEDSEALELAAWYDAALATPATRGQLQKAGLI